jgi:WhiB family redox-sensing transcriptional regulator
VTPVDPLAFLAAALEAAPASVPVPKPRRLARGAEQSVDADDPMPWRLDAACRDTDPNIFYPQLSPTERWDRTDPDVSAAMSLCRVCAVQVDCLTYALEHREDEGIWGGTDPFARKAMLRSMGGRISSGNVPLEEPEPVAEVIEMTLDEREPTAAELAELEADLDLDSDPVFDDPSDDDTYDQELLAS